MRRGTYKIPEVSLLLRPLGQVRLGGAPAPRPRAEAVLDIYSHMVGVVDRHLSRRSLKMSERLGVLPLIARQLNDGGGVREGLRNSFQMQSTHGVGVTSQAPPYILGF